MGVTAQSTKIEPEKGSKEKKNINKPPILEFHASFRGVNGPGHVSKYFQMRVQYTFTQALKEKKHHNTSQNAPVISLGA